MKYVVDKDEMIYLVNKGKLKQATVGESIDLYDRELSFYIRRKTLMENFTSGEKIEEYSRIYKSNDGHTLREMVSKTSFMGNIIDEVVGSLKLELDGVNLDINNTTSRIMEDIEGIGEIIGKAHFDKKVLERDNKKVIQKNTGGNTNMKKYVINEDTANLLKELKKDNVQNAVEQELGTCIEKGLIEAPKQVAVAITVDELAEDIGKVCASNGKELKNLSEEAIDAVASYMGEYNTQVNWIKDAVDAMEKAGIEFEESEESEEK